MIITREQSTHATNLANRLAGHGGRLGEPPFLAAQEPMLPPDVTKVTVAEIDREVIKKLVVPTLLVFGKNIAYHVTFRGGFGR